MLNLPSLKSQRFSPQTRHHGPTGNCKQNDVVPVKHNDESSSPLPDRPVGLTHLAATALHMNIQCTHEIPTKKCNRNVFQVWTLYLLQLYCIYTLEIFMKMQFVPPHLFFTFFLCAEKCATSGLTSLWHSMVSAVIRPSVDLDTSRFGSARNYLQ